MVRVLCRSRWLLLPLLVALAGSGCRAPAPDPSHIVLNDMRRPAGKLVDGVLTVLLEAREGEWRPDGADGPVLLVAAFAEAGRPMQVPGPLLRAPAGTEVRATIRNTLDRPLTVYGLGAERGVSADSALIPPAGTHEFRFVMGAAGVFYYIGRTEEVPHPLVRFEYDSQLNGALVSDEPGGRGPPRDRLLMITAWGTEDTSTVSGVHPDATLAINGAVWPHTERFTVTVGDSLHWRWINPTVIPHPMHLHGFYFRTEARGDGQAWTPVPADSQHLAVTELLLPGGVIEVAWSPSEPGNWVFHCHFAGHISSGRSLNKDRRHPFSIGEGHGVPADAAAHATHDMSGLVLGIHVRPRGRAAVAAGESRSIRLVMRSQPAVYGEYTGYAFVLGSSAAERDPAALTVPGPLLELERGRPVAVTLVNQTHEPAAVHWHGIELESFPDGVPGWSGQGRNVLQPIAPGDSFTVRFTPPRAGTFMYHSHFNEFQQIGSGMYGPIVVREPGETWAPDTERILMFGEGGPHVNLIEGPFPPVVLNGEEHPGPMELRAGVRYRLRLINIQAEGIAQVALVDGETPVQWTPVAKDGADLPAGLRTPRAATMSFAAGEIHDVEFTPERTGTLTLRFGHDFPGAPAPVSVPVRVR